MLRTRAPLSWKASFSIPSDLHVLGLPLAFILSQDQTLHCIMFCLFQTLFLTQNRNLLFRLGVWRSALPPYSCSLRLYLLQYSYTLKIDSAVSSNFPVSSSVFLHSPAALFDYLLVFIRTLLLASRFGLFSIAVKRLLFCFGYRKSLPVFFDP